MSRQKPSESSLQEACVTWFRLQYPKYKIMLFHIPNGGSRNKIEAANLKRQGVLAGVPDLFLSVPNEKYHGLYIELKYGKNKQTNEQISFQNDCVAHWYKYALVYNFEAFKKEIEEYLKTVNK